MYKEDDVSDSRGTSVWKTPEAVLGQNSPAFTGSRQSHCVPWQIFLFQNTPYRQLWGRNLCLCSLLFVRAIVCMLKVVCIWVGQRYVRHVCFHFYLATGTIAHVSKQQIIRKHEVKLQPDCGFFSLSLRQGAFVTTFLSSQSCWWLHLLGICLLVLAHSSRQNHRSCRGLADCLSSPAASRGHSSFCFQGRGVQGCLCDLDPAKLMAESEAGGGWEEVGVKRRLTLLEARRGAEPRCSSWWAAGWVWDIWPLPLHIKALEKKRKKSSQG